MYQTNYKYQQSRLISIVQLQITSMQSRESSRHFAGKSKVYSFPTENR